jgi:hypothetical protein
MLVCLYGTAKTQFHDHEKENATFKCRLFEVKCLRVRKHREHGLPADLTIDELPIIVKEAYQKRHMQTLTLHKRHSDCYAISHSQEQFWTTLKSYPPFHQKFRLSVEESLSFAATDKAFQSHQEHSVLCQTRLIYQQLVLVA